VPVGCCYPRLLNVTADLEWQKVPDREAPVAFLPTPDICLNARNVAADCFHGLVEFLLAAACDEDIGTLFDEKFCGSQPNSFCASGDDSDLTFELFGHCLSPLFAKMEVSSSDASRLITWV